MEQLPGQPVELGPGSARGVGIPVGWGMQLSHAKLVPSPDGWGSQQGIALVIPRRAGAQQSLRCRGGLSGRCPSGVWIQHSSRGRGPGGAWIQHGARAWQGLRGGDPGGGGGAWIWHAAVAWHSLRGREPDRAEHQVCRPNKVGTWQAGYSFMRSWHREAIHDLRV
jgi:hypothetical protein